MKNTSGHFIPLLLLPLFFITACSSDSDTPSNDDTQVNPSTDPVVDTGVDTGTDTNVDPVVDTNASSTADISVFYATGGAVPGIADAKFTAFNTAAISANGDVCLSASYQQAGVYLEGVWCGAPSSPQLILKTGDTIDNLAANIEFRKAEKLAISDNGKVVISSELRGASNGTAIVVWDGQSTNSILRTDELAPGFAAAAAVGTVEISSVSNSGVLISGLASTATAFAIPALWHWNGSNVNLLTSSSLFGELVPLDQNNCEVSVSTLNALPGSSQINNNGQIAFTAMLGRSDTTTDTDLCRGNAVVMSDDNGTFTTVIRGGEIVTGTTTAEYSAPALNALFDTGEMSVTSILTDDNASGLDTGRVSTWIIDRDGSRNLVTIVEETVPPNFEDRIALLAHIPIVITSSASLAVQHVQTSLGTSILAGAPHTGMPYSDIGNVGATPMQLIATSNADAPDGFPANTFISSFSRPAIDRSGRVYYKARIGETSSRDFTDVLYVAATGQAPTALLQSGSTLSYAGSPRQITAVTLPTAQQSGFAVANIPGVLISQQGNALVPATLEDYGQALLYVTAR